MIAELLAELGEELAFVDALAVLRLDDARIEASWSRAGPSLGDREVARRLRDAHRACAAAGRALAGPDDGPIGPSVLTLEAGSRTLVLRELGSVLLLLDVAAGAPLGVVRLFAGRCATALAPHLAARGDDGEAHSEAHDVVTDPPPAVPPTALARDGVPSTEGHPDAVARTMPFPRFDEGALREASDAAREAERVLRLLAYAESRAREPHTVRLRVALRSGVTPAALERLTTLTHDKLVLVETAVSDILGGETALGRMAP